MRRVLVVIMYMLAPREGNLTLDLILLDSVKFKAARARLLFLSLKESINLFYSFYFIFLR